MRFTYLSIGISGGRFPAALGQLNSHDHGARFILTQLVVLSLEVNKFSPAPLSQLRQNCYCHCRAASIIITFT